VAPSELQHIAPSPQPASNPTSCHVFPASGGMLLNLNGQSPVGNDGLISKCHSISQKGVHVKRQEFYK
jgi:hypothetical protein